MSTTTGAGSSGAGFDGRFAEDQLLQPAGTSSGSGTNNNGPAATTTTTTTGTTGTAASQRSREQSALALLDTLDQYAPVIPDAVTDHYLARAGFESDDVRLKRILALATQRFIAGIATDAFQHNRMRQQTVKDKRQPAKDRRAVLTSEDLAGALAEHGISMRKPEYYV
ncbi:transcription initiation factor IID, TAF10 subunit [Ramicandelaber brevisporus]|nr:transcription initiation factor IID, TAF10 subunit [Ramicandelaber brevisporus]